MNLKTNLEILPEDQVRLTKDQRNLVTLALDRQLPPEDEEFLESIHKDKIIDPYKKIRNYFIKKYGFNFGKIYLSAITGGEEACMETITAIEKSNARKRSKKEK
jgi:hypothetical protein